MLPGADFVVHPREPRATRDHCHQIHSCHFYSHCIESIFPCGQQGFVLSYAKKRCEIIDGIRPLVSSRKTRTWAHMAEECFKEKLLDLVDLYTDTLYPDPHTCLNFEAEAIDIMNSCYVEGGKLQLVPNMDLAKVVSLFRVDPAYHNITVDSGLVQHIGNKKSQSLADSLLSNHTLSMPNRLVFCIKGTKYIHGIGQDEVEPSHEEFVTTLRSALQESEYPVDANSIFEYGGPDDLDNRCITRSHDEDLVGTTNTNTNYNYHLVSWFTTDTIDQLINLGYVQPNQDIIAFATIFATIFELTTMEGNFSRQKTRCGDGRRQLTESCDFSYSYPGCSLDCQLMDGYDCTVNKLQASECWLEECGDGMRSRSEDCDDGNANSTDGCSNACEIEHLTHTCSWDYNKTSECTAMLKLQQQVQPASAKLISQATSHVTARHAPASSADSHEHTKRTVQPAAFVSSANKCKPTWLSLLALLGLASLSMLR